MKHECTKHWGRVESSVMVAHFIRSTGHGQKKAQLSQTKCVTNHSFHLPSTKTNTAESGLPFAGFPFPGSTHQPSFMHF
eukprot:1148804-Pelagomonas_calceolata.AAC.1